MIVSQARLVAVLLGAAVLIGVVLLVLKPDIRAEPVTKLGRHKFAIPAQYSGEGTIPNWLRYLPGLDDGSRDALIKFSASEIARHAHGYKTRDGRLEEDILARLVVLTPVEISRYHDPQELRELWLGTGSYHERVIESYQERPWFKVFRKIEYPRSWAVLTRSPVGAEPIPEGVWSVWIGHCLVGHSTLTNTGRYTSCRTRVIFGDIMVEFDIAEQNLEQLDEVKELFRKTVLSWKQP